MASANPDHCPETETAVSTQILPSRIESDKGVTAVFPDRQLSLIGVDSATGSNYRSESSTCRTVAVVDGAFIKLNHWPVPAAEPSLEQSRRANR